MAETKPVAKSSQIWVNIFMGGLAFFPQVQKIIVDNPELIPAVITIVNILWRLFLTKKPIEGIIHQKS